LNTELQYERASLADRTLRLLVKEEPSLNSLRNDLRDLIKNYETKNWSAADKIYQQQLVDSELSEKQSISEQQFLVQRKKIILSKLRELGLIQKDLGTLLNHSKSYISELQNGIRAFSSRDLILIHNFLKIDLIYLFFTNVPIETKNRVHAALKKNFIKKYLLVGDPPKRLR